MTEILRELDDHRIVMKIFNDFNQNSGGQPAEFINNLDDYEILQELTDHRINMKIFNDFDQNSGGQPNYSTI